MTTSGAETEKWAKARALYKAGTLTWNELRAELQRLKAANPGRFIVEGTRQLGMSPRSLRRHAQEEEVSKAQTKKDTTNRKARTRAASTGRSPESSIPTTDDFGAFVRSILFPPDAAMLDIASAVVTAGYRALAKEMHPDKPGGDTERMVGLNAAVQFLRDLLKERGAK